MNSEVLSNDVDAGNIATEGGKYGRTAKFRYELVGSADPKPLRVRPLANRLILRPLKEVYAGLILIPGDFKQPRGTRGIVAAMGPGMHTRRGGFWPMPDVKIGQTIVYKPEGAQGFYMDGEPYIVVRDAMVIGVVEDSDG
jgi:co-chaperonin GroES (HSP10)